MPESTRALVQIRAESLNAGLSSVFVLQHDCEFATNRHSHYTYDQEKGRAEFKADVNRILERNGIASELVDGEVRRLGPAGFHEAFGTAVFKTGDQLLDQMSDRWIAEHRVDPVCMDS